MDVQQFGEATFVYIVIVLVVFLVFSWFTSFGYPDDIEVSFYILIWLISCGCLIFYFKWKKDKFKARQTGSRTTRQIIKNQWLQGYGEGAILSDNELLMGFADIGDFHP